jgi:hypothetical protein
MTLFTRISFAIGLVSLASASFALSGEEVYLRNKSAVVTIYVSAEVERQGSGVVIDGKAGLALVTTNCHVVAGAATVEIQAQSQRTHGEVLSCDKGADVALVAVRMVGLKPAIRRESPVPVGATVFAIGTPRGFEKSISQGIVSQARATADGPLLQISAAIEPGSSGGGLFDDQGRLIGITTSKISGSQALNFAIPLSEVLAQARLQATALLSPVRGTPGSMDVKRFALRLHCSEMKEAIRQLEEDGLTLPKNAPHFCAPSDPEGLTTWVRFHMDQGKVERKVAFTVATDVKGFIDEVRYLDVWFHSARQPPPHVVALLSAVQQKYGDAVASLRVEERGRSFLGPPTNSNTQLRVFAAASLGNDLVARVQSSKSTSDVNELMRTHPGEYLIVEVSEVARANGDPLSVAISMTLKHGEAPPPVGKELRL